MTLSLQTIEAIRKDYADGVPIADIAERHGSTPGTINYWVRGGPKKGLRHLPPLTRRRRQGTQAAATQRDRKELIQTLWRTAAQQVREIEQRMKAGGQEPSERERDTRLLPVLARTLRELVAHDKKRTEDT